MSEDGNRIVLVDTNSFLRLYVSPVMPLLGQTVGAYTLMTLQSLIDEFKENQNLITKYSQVTKNPRADDLNRAAIQISVHDRSKIESEKRELMPFARAFLEGYCRKRKIAIVRNLSGKDVELLATAIVLKGVIATDEWPLREVAADLMEDDEYDIKLFSSFDILHLLEENGHLNSDDRRNTVDFWVRYGEKLHRDWRQEYQLLFGESAGDFGN